MRPVSSDTLLFLCHYPSRLSATGIDCSGRASIPVARISRARLARVLKGFVHNQLDLPFQFTVEGALNKPNSTRSTAACRFLAEYLDSQRRKVMTSAISPKRVKAGDPYTTTVNFKDTVLNGFFDNRVVHLDSDFRAWNWIPAPFPEILPSGCGDPRRSHPIRASASARRISSAEGAPSARHASPSDAALPPRTSRPPISTVGEP